MESILFIFIDANTSWPKLYIEVCKGIHQKLQVRVGIINHYFYLNYLSMASYPKRDLKYFRDVLGLPAKGLDPNHLQDEHVTRDECVKVWGPRRSRQGFIFKKSHPDTELNHRIEQLWSIIYQKKVREFGWKFGKAILAEKKGIPIDWATFAVNIARKEKSKHSKKGAKRTVSINVDLGHEPPRKKNKVSMRMGKKEVGNDDDFLIIYKHQLKKKKEGEGKTPMMTPKASQVQVENVCDVNKEHLDVGNNHPRLDEELHGPTTSMSTQSKTNINKEDEVERPLTRSKAQQVVNMAQKVSKANEDCLNLIINHPRLDERLQSLTTSMSAYESLLHCTLGSKANLEKNIENALSTCMTCKDAIATYNDLCSQQHTIDEAIVDSTHRLRGVIAHLKADKEVGEVKENKDALFFSIELEDATSWHDGLLEDKTAIASKIEAEMKDVEDKENQLNAANEELLGLLMQYYKMFGKESNLLDSMQKQLELLQKNFYELKALCDSGGVDGH